ncbi:MULTISPECIES: hypothetical protein [Streptomyces]|uniref:Uncharacterized protein n=1 Tax=Streptomyces canarius TaxID=285453 RepID=A0ABQ3CQS8_9ACTN|nr:hypothetical protein [Streptomyces canarius]GHA34098.1 hypothetical protein GCM10010345_43330 [Streptomyces canarius]
MQGEESGLRGRLDSGRGSGPLGGVRGAWDRGGTVRAEGLKGLLKALYRAGQHLTQGVRQPLDRAWHEGRR